MRRWTFSWPFVGDELHGVRAGVADRFPQPGRLRRLHARAAQLFDEQAAGEERLVAEHLGVEPEAGAAGEQAVLGIRRYSSGETCDDCR